jgi:rhodanese-related sulfurtransferase
MVALLAVVIAIVCVGVGLTIRFNMLKKRREFARYTIDPEELHRLQEQGLDVLVLDVRLPLDLLAYSEIIPGAVRIAPKEIQANPQLIPRDKDAVVYCTCPDQGTSLGIVRKAAALGFERVKVLRGGLAGWKAKGLPVTPFTESFHLDTAT